MNCSWSLERVANTFRSFLIHRSIQWTFAFKDSSYKRETSCLVLLAVLVTAHSYLLLIFVGTTWELIRKPAIRGEVYSPFSQATSADLDSFLDESSFLSCSSSCSSTNHNMSAASFRMPDPNPHPPDADYPFRVDYPLPGYSIVIMACVWLVRSIWEVLETYTDLPAVC